MSLPPPCDLLVRDSELLVTLAGDPIPGGWVAVNKGLVVAVGRAGAEPVANEVLSARGGLVTPGLINTHHHIYQNLTRSYAPALKGGLFNWLTTLYPLWSRLDEEAASRVRSALTLETGERVDALLSAVRDYPDTTLAAIHFFIALRQNGLPVRNNFQNQQMNIPKRIGQFWDSAEPPREISDFTATWRDLNPGYGYELFTEGTAEAYPVDSGSPTCSVLIGGNRAATRTLFDGRRSFACPIPEGLS